MNVLPLNHIWFFLTDRCNLRCEYCFFKNKTGKLTLSERSFQSVMHYAASIRAPEFILSGGEPLLAWPCVRHMVRQIREEHPRSYLSVQSNLTLLDKRKTMFLKDHHVNVEVGLDGDEQTTLMNRPGVFREYYKKVCRGIDCLKQARVRMTATMTVHPEGAKDLFSNLMVLDQLGLRQIEVHPAFLEDWDECSAAFFLDGYRKASGYELRAGRKGLIGRGYSFPSQGAWDMVILPDGKVLPNWIFLSFPEKVRRKFYVMDFSGGAAKVLSAADAYFYSLRRFLSWGRKSYRQISNFNAKLAMKEGFMNPNNGFEAYVRLCDAIEKIDLKVIGKVK